jgi:thioredoxin 1
MATDRNRLWAEARRAASVALGAVLVLCLTGGCSSHVAKTDAPAAAAQVVEIQSKADFEEHVLKAATPALVDFYAVWCGPCKELVPVLDALSAQYKGKVAFARMDAEKVQAVSEEYRIEGYPTVVLFAQGKEVKRVLGLVPEADLRALLDSALAQK